MLNALESESRWSAGNAATCALTTTFASRCLLGGPNASAVWSTVNQRYLEAFSALMTDYDLVICGYFLGANVSEKPPPLDTMQVSEVPI